MSAERLDTASMEDFRNMAAVLVRVEALADERDVLYPEKFASTPSGNYVAGYRAARRDLRAALRGDDA